MMANTRLVPLGYRRLVSDIAAVYHQSRRMAIRAYWQIGKRIVEVEQDGAVKSAYGTGLLRQLSADLSKQLGPGFSETNLKRFRQFYLQNRIRPPADELQWSYRTELLKITDKKRRLALERCIQKDGLNRDELRALIRRRNSPESNNNERRNPPAATLLKPPQDLRIATYQKVGDFGGDKDVLDCGFHVFRTVLKKDCHAVTITEKPSYSYEAIVERVIDGDTLIAVIDVGFGTRVREKLRLRGIDCPELNTPAGEQAKRFVIERLPEDSKILIKTYKTDLYGRFVADVFIPGRNDQTSIERATAVGRQDETDTGQHIFLNNLLLETGYAVNI